MNQPSLVRIVVTFLIGLLIMGNVNSCDTSYRYRNMSVYDSLLYKDITADSRDSIYRAMIYIGRCGGPQMIGSSTDLTNLIANREPLLEWLLEQQENEKILEEYEEYRKRWGPMFMD